MSTSTTDEIKGTFHEVKGKVKETVGQVTNNPDLEAEGKAEHKAGKVEKKDSDRRVLASPRQSPRKEDGTLRPGIDRCVSHTSICFFGNRRDNYSARLTCAISGSVISGAGRFWGRGGLSGARIQNRPTFMGFLPVSNPTSFSLTSLGFSSHQRWAGRKCFCRRGP